MNAAAVSVGRQIRAATYAVVLALTIVAAGITWGQVVERLRSAEPIEVTGSASAIVWSGRVFRSEAELARYFRARGVNYEQWVKTHPAAVAILRSRGRPVPSAEVASGSSGQAAPSAPAAAEEEPEPTATSVAASPSVDEGPRLTAGALAIPAVMTLGLLLAIGALLPERVAERKAGTTVGRVLELAGQYRVYLIGAALSVAVGGLLSVAL